MSALAIVCIVLGLVNLGLAWWAIYATGKWAYWHWMWEGEHDYAEVLTASRDRRLTLQAELDGIAEEMDQYKQEVGS